MKPAKQAERAQPKRAVRPPAALLDDFIQLVRSTAWPELREFLGSSPVWMMDHAETAQLFVDCCARAPAESTGFEMYLVEPMATRETEGRAVVRGQARASWRGEDGCASQIGVGLVLELAAGARGTWAPSGLSLSNGTRVHAGCGPGDYFPRLLLDWGQPRSAIRRAGFRPRRPALALAVSRRLRGGGLQRRLLRALRSARTADVPRRGVPRAPAGGNPAHRLSRDQRGHRAPPAVSSLAAAPESAPPISASSGRSGDTASCQPMSIWPASSSWWASSTCTATPSTAATFPDFPATSGRSPIAGRPTSYTSRRSGPCRASPDSCSLVDANLI